MLCKSFVKNATGAIEKEIYQWGCYMKMDIKVSKTKIYGNMWSKTVYFDQGYTNQINKHARSQKKINK